jgi:Asp-tRNA(Asn)/Glu-tRNA(Gln) amidotransferase A subunit family amidase
MSETTAAARVEQALEACARTPAASAYFVHRLDAQARAQALELDTRRTTGDPTGALAGTPVVVKDNLAIAGVVPTAASRARMTEAVACAHACVVGRLVAAGAIPIATTNMNELAYGFTGENAWHGDVPNPRDETRMSGGSSSGSAAAVASGLVALALGTDTNGSVRVPAALCGIWGYRPSPGVVPSEGIVPLAPTLDVAGPLARTARDLMLAASILAGFEHPAGTSGTIPPRVAVARVGDDRMTTNVRAAVDRISRALGAREIVTIPAAGLTAASQIITAVEGARTQRAILKTRPEEIGATVRRRLLAGALVPAAAYDRALELRDRAHREMREHLADFDIVVAPATPCSAPERGAQQVEFDGIAEPTNAALGRYTSPFSLTGCAVVVVPVMDVGPLPVGVQLVAKPGDDALAIRAACAIEDALLGGPRSPE